MKVPVLGSAPNTNTELNQLRSDRIIEHGISHIRFSAEGTPGRTDTYFYPYDKSLT